MNTTPFTDTIRTNGAILTNRKLTDTIIKSLQHNRQLFRGFYVCFMTCFHKFMEVGIVQIMVKFF